MQSKAKTVQQYLAELPADRRAALTVLRQTFLKNLDPAYQEGMQYGMVGYCVPHKLFPAGYHCDPSVPLPFAGFASQKNHMSMYIGCFMGSDKETAFLREGFAKAGKKLDMGKACIRFKKIDDLPLDVIGAAIKRMPAKKWIAIYQAQLDAMPAQREARRKAKKSAPATKSARKSTTRSKRVMAGAR